MSTMKKALALGLTLTLLLVALTGCSTGKQADAKNADALSILMVNNAPVETALREQFPDIPFDFQYYDGFNATSNVMLQVQHHDLTDIFLGTLPLSGADAVDNLLDLSRYAFCDNFEPSMLNQYDIDGKIYQFPTATSMRCIIYNKEMFDAHGWKEPQNFGELVALCRRIREETDVTPIVFGGAAGGYYFTTMTTFAQMELLYKSEGAQLEQDYLAGKAGAEEVFGVGIEMVQELIDAGAFDVEKQVDLWDVVLFKECMATGKAAMQFAWGVQDQLFGLVDESETDYGVMPFRNRDGDAFIGTGGSFSIGLSKNLEKPGNEKKLENALRVMEWLSTEEGQMKINYSKGSIVYPVKDASNAQTLPQFRELWDKNLDSIKMPMLYDGYEDIMLPAADYITEAMKGEHDLSGLAALIDEVHQAALNGGTDDAIVYAGSFSKTFTHEQTVQTMAEMLHAKGDSDITLITDGQRIGKVKNPNGCHSKFYEGPLLYNWVTVYAPGSITQDNDMVQMTLTGAQIQELLETGKNMVLYEGATSGQPIAEDEAAVASSRYPYWWAGMKVDMKDGKFKSMTLSDGAPVEPDKTYTVSFAAEDYMDTTAAAGNPVPLGYSAQDAFTEYLQNHSPVAPVEPQRK